MNLRDIQLIRSVADEIVDNPDYASFLMKQAVFNESLQELITLLEDLNYQEEHFKVQLKDKVQKMKNKEIQTIMVNALK